MTMADVGVSRLHLGRACPSDVTRATGRAAGGAHPKAARVGRARCRIRTEGGIIGALAWTRAVIVSAGTAACLAGCITGAPIPPTYTPDELKAICERNGFRWYRDDLTGGFCERR
jgi:hypothetical protein